MSELFILKVIVFVLIVLSIFVILAWLDDQPKYDKINVFTSTSNKRPQKSNLYKINRNIEENEIINIFYEEEEDNIEIINQTI